VAMPSFIESLPSNALGAEGTNAQFLLQTSLLTKID